MGDMDGSARGDGAQPKAARSGGVQSVERVFDLMEAIADAGGEISLSDLAAASSLPLPTIHRLLRTLVSLGYARQLPSRRYALGPRLIRLGERAGKQLGTLAGPVLEHLVRELGETSNLAMLDGDGAVYVAQRPSPHAMRMFTEVGRRVNLHNTGVGKALRDAVDHTVPLAHIVPDWPDPLQRDRAIDSLVADGLAEASDGALRLPR